MIWYLRSSRAHRPAEVPRRDAALGAVRRHPQGRRPGLINIAITNLSVVVLTGIAGQLGREAAIGYAMGARLEYILQPVAFGFGTAIVAMVGTNWGARQYRRAREIAWTGAAHGRAGVRHDRADRRDPPGAVDRPVQRRCRGRAYRRPLPAHRRTGLSLLRAGPRAVLRHPGRRPRRRGDERQRGAHDRRARAAGSSPSTGSISASPGSLPPSPPGSASTRRCSSAPR